MSLRQRINTPALLLNVAEWGLLLMAMGLVVFSADYRPWMLLSLGLLAGSIVARLLRIGRIASPTPLDIPVLLLSLSVLVAWWVAPARDSATIRLLWYAVAVAVFYSLASSDDATRMVLGRLYVLFAALGGLLVVSQRDWSEWTRFGFIGRIGRVLNQIIPDLGLQTQFWNVTRNNLATILALAVPFGVMWLVYTVHKRSSRARWQTVLEAGLAVLALGFIAFCILMTESRAPWLLAPMVVGIVGWWVVVERRFGRIKHPLRLFWVGILGFTLVGLIGLYVLAPIIPQLPGPNTYQGRINVYTNSLYLAQDVPFTGAGLNAFPQYYSEYVRVVPVNAVRAEDTGNNAFQSVWVEQGWLGMIGYTLLMGVGAWTMTRHLQALKQPHPFIIAGVIAFAYVVLQSMVHATLVETRATMVLLLPAGFALAGYPVKARRERLRQWRQRLAGDRRYQIALGGAVVIIGVILLAQWNVLRASWYANQGVLAMAEQDSAEWPRGVWDDGRNVARYGDSEALFEKALTYDSDNATAHFRLALIDMLHRDYPTAVAHLQDAHAQQPGHRGIRKNLGYSLTWTGNYDAALTMLDGIWEAPAEMGQYNWWWQSQSRPELSQHAAAMNARLLAQREKLQ